MVEIVPRRQVSSVYYQVLLLFGDAVLLYLALWAALALRYPGTMDIDLFLRHAQPFTVVFALWVFLLYTNNLYNLTRVRDQLNIYFDLTRALLVGTVIAVLIFYLLPAYDLTPKRLLVLDAAIFGVALTLWRAWFVNLFRRTLPTNNIAIIGLTPASLELGRELRTRPASGYRLVAFVDDGDQTTSGPQLEGVRVLTDPQDLLRPFQDLNINTLVISDKVVAPASVGQLFALLPLQLKFYSLADFYEEFTNKVPVSHLTQGWFLSNLDETAKRSYDILRRFIDIVVAGGFLTAFFPVLIALGILVKLNSRGPAFYHQARVGHRGQLFHIWKLRTMVADAEKLGPQWSQRGDPRVTAVGRFLRRTRLDEIPQLINVLRGEMSLVGPRSERPEFVDNLVPRNF